MPKLDTNFLTEGTWTYEYGAVYDDKRGCVLMADRNNPNTLPTECDANIRLAGASKLLLEATRALVTSYLQGKNYETKNAYARLEVAQAMAAIKRAVGFEGDWQDVIDYDGNIAVNFENTPVGVEPA